MQINKVENTSFKGIYRLKNTPANLDALQDKILPIYEGITKRPAQIFIGSNPFKEGVDWIVNSITRTNNVTKKWLKMKAEKNGLPPFTTSNDGILHVVTTQKDIDILNDYKSKRMDARCTRAKERIKSGNKEPVEPFDKDLPDYLLQLWSVLMSNQEEEEAFSKYPQKIIEVGSVEELFSKIMSEK